MPPGDDVGGLAEADALGARGDRRLGEQRIGAVLRAFGLEVMLGHEEIVEVKLVAENALANLVDERALRALMDFSERAVVDDHAILRGDDLQVARSVLENSDFDHAGYLPRQADA